MKNKIDNILAEKEAFKILETFEIENGCLLMDKYVPWISFAKEKNIRAAIYPSVRGGYNIMVADSDQWKLPKDWLLNKPKGMGFIHKSLFICQFDTKDNALEAYRCIL